MGTANRTSSRGRDQARATWRNQDSWAVSARRRRLTSPTDRLGYLNENTTATARKWSFAIHGFLTILAAVAAEVQVGACSDGWPEFSESYATARKVSSAYVELGEILGFLGGEQRAQLTNAYDTANGLRRNGLALVNTPEQYMLCKNWADGVTATASQVGIR